MQINEIKLLQWLSLFNILCTSQGFYYQVITIYFVYVQYLLYLIFIDIVTAK